MPAAAPALAPAAPVPEDVMLVAVAHANARGQPLELTMASCDDIGPGPDAPASEREPTS